MKFLPYILTFLLAACTIEPPLYLPGKVVGVDRQAVEIEVTAVWENPEWEDEFLYGWEASDIATFGPVEYEPPIDYELRLYYIGDSPDSPHKQVTPGTIRDDYFRSMFLFGYHDILLWSNIYTPDFTQSVIIQENLNEVRATVTPNSGASDFAAALTPYVGPDRAKVFHQPEVFYSAYTQNFYVSPDTLDYDYYDHKNLCWVKRCELTSAPLVYMYLLQVVLRNNDGRITGANLGAAISGITDTTSVNYGTTSDHTGTVHFDLGAMRKKVATPSYVAEHHSGFRSQCQAGDKVDVLGGRFTTYGLCGMQGYLSEKSRVYNGSQPHNRNVVAVDFAFRNGRDSIVTFDITPQLHRTCHGGVLTVEVDASEIPMPYNPNPKPSGGSGFDPWIENYEDSIMYDFDM